MKTAKKLLCLMIVLVMAFGLLTFASADPADMNVDDYADFESIEYVEAVDVLTALGILQGDGDAGARSFRPSDTITRAEASKIISYILLGTRAADQLVPSATGFSDVPSSHWASPFVAYCVQRGIINGYGNGMFGPSDPVTASQMAKMLLTAVGYGTQGEYVGPSWEIRVLDRAMARSIEILSRTGNIDYSAAATREQVAQYTFNALTIPVTVTWNSFLNDYVDFSGQNLVGQNPIPNQNLGEKTFGLLTIGARDDYGFGGVKWTLNNTRTLITGYYTRADILSVTTNGTPLTQSTTGGAALTVIGARSFVARYGFDPNSGPPLTRYDVYDVPMVLNGTPVPTGSGNAARINAIRLTNMPGVIVNLVNYSLDGTVEQVVIIAKTAQEALGAPIIAGNGNVTIPGIVAANLYIPTPASPPPPIAEYNATPSSLAAVSTSISNLPAREVVYPSGITRGDMLLVHEKVDEDGTVIIVVEKADSITGQMTRAVNNRNITFGGETYAQSGLVQGVLFDTADPYTFPGDGLKGFISTTANFNADATIWLDDNGDVIRAKADATLPAPYGVLVSYSPNTLGAGWFQARATIIQADGTIGTFYVAAAPNGLVPNQTADFPNVIAPGGSLYAYLVTYELNEDGAITLTPAGTASSVQNANYNRGSSRVELSYGGGNRNFTIGSDTQVFYYANAMYSATTTNYTGGRGPSAASMNVNIAVPVLYATVPGTTNTLAAVVFLQGNTGGATNWAYLTSVAATIEIAGSTTLYKYGAWIDGEFVPDALVTTRLTDFPSVGLYSYTLAPNGRVTTATPSAPAAPNNNIITAYDGARLTWDTFVGNTVELTASANYWQVTATDVAAGTVPISNNMATFRLLGYETNALGQATNVYYSMVSGSILNSMTVNSVAAGTAPSASANGLTINAFHNNNVLPALEDTTTRYTYNVDLTWNTNAVYSNYTSASLDGSNPNVSFIVEYSVNSGAWVNSSNTTVLATGNTVDIRINFAYTPWSGVTLTDSSWSQTLTTITIA